MKLITSNFIKCPIKKCDSSLDSYPLSYQNCQLVIKQQDFNANFIKSMLNRLDWDALLRVAKELGNTLLPLNKPALENSDQEEDKEDDEENLNENDLKLLKDLHNLLLETNIIEGEMICRSCNHKFYIKGSIPNLLLPPHLVD
ncbi:RNA methylation protein TRM112 [Ascoidea rubescens DSM 1968]|uniref:Trm112p-domain-containing protein n=1 Tax=Ascoidea rubescens DSM 1968 TaxID=1344418 RepID=A0A1D2VJ06_9ASCO|nr:Trm112p-domain-containing protein [Ascoidea rubescens DSM 1968]ODV61611.1 Trm112p-domain-containing protein [Ascoidea rubescens DSM 1968]